MAQEEITDSGKRTSFGMPEFNDRNAPSSSSVAALLSPKWPRKSILKHTESENATVPLTRSKTMEPNSVRPLDRRVSFAEKVQLHKIEISPYSPGNPSSHNSSSDIDDESSDVDTSFSALEADADKVLTMLQAGDGKQDENAGGNPGTENPDTENVQNAAAESLSPHNEFLVDENTDEDSENSMELTEPIRGASLREIPNDEPAVSGSLSIEHRKEETIVSEPETSLNHAKGSLNSDGITQNELERDEDNHDDLSNENIPELGEHASEHDFPYTHQDFEFHHVNGFVSNPTNESGNAPSLTSSEDFLDGKEEMEFTSQVARFNYDELTMELTLPQPSNLASLSTRSAGFESAIGVFETSMDLTNNGIFPHVLDRENDEEITMEFTKQVESVSDPPEEKNEETTMEITQRVDKTSEKPSQNSEEVAVDITKQVENSNETEEVTMDITKQVENNNDTEEVTMDITKPVGNSNDTEEVTMDITKPVEAVNKDSHEDKNNNSVTDEETAMELTQPVNNASNTTRETHFEGPVASSTQTQTQENMSPILVESQEAGDEDPDLNINPTSENKTEESTPNKKVRDADLSTINEEDSDSESHFGAIANPETVQTPTNFELEENEIANFPVENLDQDKPKPASPVSRNSSTSSLSDDINVYDNDSPDENSDGKHSLRPAMNPSPTKRHKPSKEEAPVGKKQVEEPEKIFYNDEWDVPDISLSEFLDNIGVKFYDDLEIGTDAYQPSSRSNSIKFSDAHYYKANIQLPLLEVYDLSCKELAEKIQQGKILFDEIKEKSLQNNPVLFKRYLSASSYDKSQMRTRFHSMKEYTKQQAKEVWYEWRKKLFRNIVEVYQKDLEMLRDEKSIMESSIDSVEQSFKKVQSDIRTMRFDLERFKEIKSNFKDLSVEKIKEMRISMASLNQRLLKYSSMISEKEASLKSLEKTMSDRSNMIQSLKARGRELEETLNKTKHFNSKEIEGLEVNSRILQACAGLKFVSKHEHIYDFELDPQIGITVDTTKLDTPQGLSLRALQSDTSMLRNLSLATAFIDIVNTGTASNAPSVVHKLKIIREVWSKILNIDREIFQINLRYPVKFHADTNEVIKFEFEYLSLGATTKIKFTTSIPKEKVLEYPVNISVDVQVLRGEGGKTKIVQEAIADIRGKYSMISMFSMFSKM